VREFVEREVAPLVDDHWGRAEFPYELIPKLAELDVVGLGYHRDDRPARSRLVSSFLTMELARVDASFATFFGVHSGLAMGSIVYCGSEEQKQRWLPDMFSLKKIGAFALTEPHGGSDVALGWRPPRAATATSGSSTGAKRWIGNATFADYVVVWARDVDDNQVKGFVVEKGTPGFTATKMEGKLALRMVQNADITFEDCRVPEANRLQHANSFRDTSRVLRLTRGGVAWNAVGVMIGAYEAAVAYAKDPQAVRQADRELPADPGSPGQDARRHHGLAGHGGARRAVAGRRRLPRRAGGAGEALLHGAHARRGRPRPRGVRRQRGPAREQGRPLLQRLEALYSYEGTREINTLIVGRAITGMGAFA
jgi:glutaryl-CoA dehydrogenase